jgi:hypothetical protein
LWWHPAVQTQTANGVAELGGDFAAPRAIGLLTPGLQKGAL